MKLSLDLRTSLSQTLTPQQIQYLKLLQLPLVQLEQQVRQEIELNPMLEEFDPDYPSASSDLDSDFSQTDTNYANEDSFPKDDFSSTSDKPQIDDQVDPFEFYKMVWQDESDYGTKNRSNNSDEDDYDGFQIKDSISLIDDLLQQIRMLDLTETEYLLAEQILGNVDNDGYLRRETEEIVEETNAIIEEANIELQAKIAEEQSKDDYFHQNPARQFAISQEAAEIVNGTRAAIADNTNLPFFFKKVSLLDAEKILAIIRHLEPPGIASRNIQECLIAQCKAIPKKNAAQKLALEILENAYDALIMKHFNVIIKQLEVTEDYLREAIEVIRKLNPKPGGTDSQSEMNSVIPDFLVTREEDTNELMITVNDSRLPAIRVSTAYDKIKKEAKYKVFNKETRDWIRNKYEDAKFLIQAIRQRKSTMLKVMTSIAALQNDFFYIGPNNLKPMIYKDISEQTGLDISTVCRIVNGKYVQTEFGTFELKYFFSESLPNEDGEEISTRVIKQIIKDIIDEETKNKPLSDDKIAAELKKRGYMVARRTVAKYREQLKIPVARLRKEL